jgi:molecular chaperone DnaK (HSP70)
VHNLLLIGGNARIPKFQKAISSLFSNVEHVDEVNADELSVCGAAKHAQFLMDHPDSVLGVESGFFAGQTSVSAAPHDIRVGLLGGMYSWLTRARARSLSLVALCDRLFVSHSLPLTHAITHSHTLPVGKCTPLLNKGAALPVRVQQRFATTVDKQSSLVLELYEGESAAASGCVHLATVHVSSILPKVYLVYCVCVCVWCTL